MFKKKLCSSMAAAGLSFYFVNPANALLITQTSNPDLAISNNTSISNIITIADVEIINWLEVDIAVNHTWVGDLIFSLTHDATTVTLMDRPGKPPLSSAFSVFNFFGDSSNLSAKTPITFSDNDGKGTVNPTAIAENMGSSFFCVDSETIGSSLGCGGKTYRPHQALSAFTTLPSNGNWTLKISDNASGDTGRLASWTLRMDITPAQATVPEPATLALLGLGLVGLGLTRRRRRA